MPAESIDRSEIVTTIDTAQILPHGPERGIQESERDRNAAAIELLHRWGETGDEEEQRESLANLKRALDENRQPGERKLFP